MQARWAAGPGWRRSTALSPTAVACSPPAIDAVRVDAALSAFEEGRCQALTAEAGFGIFPVLAGRWGCYAAPRAGPHLPGIAVSSLLSDISPAWLAAARLTLELGGRSTIRRPSGD